MPYDFNADRTSSAHRRAMSFEAGERSLAEQIHYPTPDAQWYRDVATDNTRTGTRHAWDRWEQRRQAALVQYPNLFE